VQTAEQQAGAAGREHAEPRRAGKIRGGVTGHRTGYENAFEAEIDAPALLRQTFADAHEQIRRAHANGAREQRQQQHGDG
jgi:hypothetical protein